MLTDIRHSLRLVIHDPAFSLVACVTLALGIGANTAIFSVVDAALFRPLPYKSADRLVDVLVEAQLRSGGTAQVRASGRHADRLRAIPQVFDRVEAFSDARPKDLAAGWGRGPSVGAISPTLGDFLGVSPQVGRPLTREDALSGNAILISDAYWSRAYNRDRAVVGKAMAFTDRTCVIVGVMPPAFRYFVDASTDAWLPLADEREGDRLVARLRPGITLAQAQREANAALARASRPMKVELLAAGWDRGTSAFGGTVATRTMLFTLVGAVGFVLLIACANVANLLLARTLTRQREIAIRGSLGASRLRLARQFLVEGLVLSALGGLAAAALAWSGIRAIPTLAPANQLRALFGVSLPELDARVLAFGMATAILTGILCGAVPALRASFAVSGEGLLACGRHIAGSSRGQRRLRSAFQALQVALTLVLLAGAGLLVTSFVRMVTVPRGFNEANLAYASVQVPRTWKLPQFAAFFDELAARVGALPGVGGVTVARPPVSGYSNRFVLEDGEGPSSVAVPLEEFRVQPNYFRVAGIALKEGRLFGPEDGPNTTPVAIISERTARRFWPGQSAIGRRFRMSWSAASPLTVVGVVADVRTLQVAQDGMQAYRPGAQAGAPNSLLFRIAGASAPVIAAIRAEVRAMDAAVTIDTIGTVSGLVADVDPFGMPRFYASLLGLLAGIALLTAAVGLYGLLSYSVGRRIQEIGVRMALGANPIQVRWLVVGEALAPVMAGVALGLLASFWLTRLIAAQLFRVRPHDPLTIASIVLLLLATSAAAAFGPAYRASRVDPVEALRAE